MTRRSLALAALLTGGCTVPDGSPLSRLTEVWGAETAEIASPSATAALVLAGLSADLCVTLDEDAWADLGSGDLPPVSDALVQALGDPTIDEVEVFSSGAIQATLSGVVIMDRDSAIVRLFTTPSSTSFGFEAAVLDGRQGTDTTSEPFGRVAFDVQPDCGVGSNRVLGTAHWTDLEERTQTVSLPADAELSSGVGFDTDTPYLPTAGTMAWTARIDGMERTISSADASEITVDADTLQASWPIWVRGDGWVTENILQIVP